MAAESYLRRLTRRLTEDPEQRDAEKLSDEAVNTGAQRAIDCERGQEVTMVGTLRCVETNAKGCADGVRAESNPHKALKKYRDFMRQTSDVRAAAFELAVR